MSCQRVVWFAGDREAQDEIAAALEQGLASMETLQTAAHRTVHRILTASALTDTQPPVEFVVKIHHVASGRHRLREAFKRRLGRSPARREWLALVSLHARGVDVPRPRAWGRLENGDEIVVTEALTGISGRDCFRSATVEERLALANALASTLRTLHDGGDQHGDLHLGNLLVMGNRIVLLDLQNARALRNPRERLRDLATLELSLARAGWSLDERSSFRDLLAPNAQFESVLRHFLKDHLRGRSRRRLRIGRDWATAEFDGLRGLREQSISSSNLREVIRSANQDPAPKRRRQGRIRITEAKIGDRIVVVKRVDSSGLRRALGDRIRGTSGERAFRKGQMAGLLSGRAARPLAYLEERHLGFAFRSWLVLEKIGEMDLDCIAPENRELEIRIASTLGAWLAEAHTWGLSHRDLKASNIRMTIRESSIDFWLIDLEDLTGPTELSDDARLRALSQLNASLCDEAFGLDARRRALATYLARAPFKANKAGAPVIVDQIVRQSLARKHRWQGIGCDLGRTGQNQNRAS
jgi:tRNA A-37 threonylcarbamoyl transferase component Bud32